MPAAARLALSLACLLLAAAPARAAGLAEGEGYRLRIPPGFEAVDASQIPGGRLNFSRSFMGSTATAEIRVYVRDEDGPREAALTLMAIRIEGPMADKFGQGNDLAMLEETYRTQFESVPGVEEVHLRQVEISSGIPALEMSLVVSPDGRDPVLFNTLFVVHDEQVIMLMFTAPGPAGPADIALWRALVGSLRVETPSVLSKYALYGLGGLLLLIGLLVALRLMRAQPGYRRGADLPPPTVGMSRALDGLPTYGASEASFARSSTSTVMRPPPRLERAPVLDPAGGGAAQPDAPPRPAPPRPAPALPSAPPAAPSRLEFAAHPEAPAPSAAPTGDVPTNIAHRSSLSALPGALPSPIPVPGGRPEAAAGDPDKPRFERAGQFELE